MMGKACMCEGVQGVQFSKLFDHIHHVVSTLVNVVKLDFENDNVVSTLSNIGNINVEIYNVELTLLRVVNFNIDAQNVVSTLA